MKNKLFFRLLWVILFTCFSISIQAQPTYLLELRNDVQVSCTVFEFDVYLLRTGTTTLELGAVQYGIFVNPLIISGGTITASVVSGSVDPILVASNQGFKTIGFTAGTQNCIKVSSPMPPGSGNGAIISNVSPGTRLCRIRLTNTVSFGHVAPNLTWTTTTIYPVQITAYVGGYNTIIYVPSSQTTNNLANLALSYPAAPTGLPTQSFCSDALPTVSNLVATGTSIQWYDASSGGTVLATSTALVSGTHYYASQTVGSCESSDRLDVTATVYTTAAPTGTATQTFCSDASPTVASMTATGTDIKWYAASSGGTALATTTALTTATHYWASQTENACESPDRFDVTVTINGQLNATLSSVNSTCFGLGDGSITFANSSGGSGVWNYSITGGTSWFGSAIFSGLGSGTYATAIQDENDHSCIRSLGSIVITEPQASNGGTVNGGTIPICYGSSTGPLTVSGYTGTIIKWQKRLGSDPWTDISNITDTYSETPSSTGTWEYLAVVQNGTGCTTANSIPLSLVVSEAVTASAGSNQSVSGTWTVTLDGNSPSYGTGTWVKQSGPGNASFLPDANTNNATVTVDVYGTYTFRWTILNGGCSAFDDADISFSAACSSTSTFNGTGNWNDNSKWDNGIPTSCINATIDGDVTVTANGECNKLIVNAGKSVIIDRFVTLAVSDSLRLKANSNGNAAMIDKGTLTYPESKCEVLIYLAGSNARDTLYHMFSAPVVTPSINTFWYFFMFHYDELIADWVINFTNDFMVNGLGYAGFYTGNISQNPNITLKYHGYSLNTGAHAYNLSNSGEDPSHYNLIGNPYPSPVNLDSLSFTGVDDAVYFWNSSGTWAGQYGSYNISSHLSSMNGGNILPAHQAIFVCATGTSPSVSFSNNSRVKSSHPFYKSYNTLANHLQLVVNANEYNDALIVGFTNNATKEYDGKYDARKLFGGYEMIPSLYSKTDDGVKVAINELPQIRAGESVVVPVEFSIGINGAFTLRAQDINTFNNETSIYLEDKTANSMINLKDNDTYTFNYNTGESADRFNLHFRMAANGIDVSSSTVNIYSYDKSIYVSSDNSLNGSISVYNVLGQEIISRQLDGKTIYIININDSSKGYYLVKVITANKTITKKVYID